MEYKSPYLFILGLFVSVLWSLDYWKIIAGSLLSVGFQQGRRQSWRAITRFILFIIGLIGWGYLSYALTQPRLAKSFSPSSREVVDIVLVVDVSRSMLAEDLKPNRLEVTKRELRKFAQKRITDRVGLVIFSEKVFTLMPLSTDPDLLDKVIGDIDIGYLGSGTNIGDGLGLGVARAAESEAKNKVIILLTDGVANVGNLTPYQAAEEARKQGIRVYTIGVGSHDDAKIPVGKTVFGTQYQLIPGGSIDYKTLQEISSLTQGKFYPATDEQALERVFADIDKLEKTEIKVENQVVYNELYYSYFAIGLALILIVEVLKRAILREIA
ncbi:MAG: VWA domain-containing protein [Bacteriovoracaceae bacterium]|nr:VWA domain-containing protein [Bacteriovoracaceae bacterium]